MRSGCSKSTSIKVLTFIFVSCLLLPAISQNAVADNEKIDFTVNLSSIGLIGGFSASIDWPSQLDVVRGGVAFINYDIKAATGSITITIPFSSISFGAVPDQDIKVPIPITPIGTQTIPITEYVAQIPSGMASLNLDIQTSVSLLNVLSSSGYSDVLSSKNDLEWTSWGAKSLKIQTHNNTKEVTVTSKFGYAISIGVSATFLGNKIELIHPLQITAVPEQGSHTTVIHGVDSPLLLIILGATSAGIACATVILLRKKRNKSEKGVSESISDDENPEIESSIENPAMDKGARKIITVSDKTDADDWESTDSPYSSPFSPYDDESRAPLMPVILLIIGMLIISAFAVATMMSLNGSNEGNQNDRQNQDDKQNQTDNPDETDDQNKTILPIPPMITNLTAKWGSLDMYDFRADDGSKYLWITLTLQNNWTESIYISPYYFKVQGEDGTQYTSYEGNGPDGLAPGAVTTFSMVFKVSSSWVPSNITYSDWFSHTSTAAIPLPDALMPLAILSNVTAVFKNTDSQGWSWSGEIVLYTSFNLTNNWTKALDTLDYRFQVYGKDGTYETVWRKTGPDSIQPGATGSFTIQCIVPTSFDPDYLQYDMSFGPYASIPVPTPS